MSPTWRSLWGALALMVAGIAHADAAVLSDLRVPGMQPAFDPAVTQYTLARTGVCSVPVSATLVHPTHRLYISSRETASGATRNAWICDGASRISVVVYAGWTEVGRYTVTLVDAPPPPPPPPPAGLAALAIEGLEPAFDPAVKRYTIPRTGCFVAVTATLADLTHRLYVANAETPSGTMRGAWVCDDHKTIDIVVYRVWTEVARFTVDVIDPPVPPAADPPQPDMPAADPPQPDMPAADPPDPDDGAADPPQPDAPLPALEPTDAWTAERLLHQATFGPTAADVADVQAKGVARWLAEQRRLPASEMPDGLDENRVQARLFLNMANGPDQLRQRMVFALSQILVVSTNKNVNGYELIPWVRLLSQHAFGNYRDLLREVTLSPTMGKFLDLANSRRAMGGSAPNENYPRELMQLFSIGLFMLTPDGRLQLDARGEAIPTYDQATVREVARALTGWTYPTAPGQAPRSQNPENFVGRMEARPESHDAGAKTLFRGIVLPAGRTVEQDLESVVDAVFLHPNTGPFVATRLIRSLVTSNPSPAYVERVARVFANRGDGVRGDLAAVLTAILTDDEAALEALNAGRLKDPVLHVIGLARALGVQVADPGLFLYVMSDLGQEVLSPPTVFSFYSPLGPLPGQAALFGPEFQIYTPALAVQRANFLYAILNGDFGSAFPVDLEPYVELADDPDALVDRVDEALLFGRMSPALREVISDAVDAVSDSRQRALGALYLTAISSEFSVHSGPTL